VGKALLYKEWIKLRWLWLGALTLCLAALAYLAIDLRHILKVNAAIDVWLYIVQRKHLYYQILKYLPLLIGAVTSLAQFIPEMTKNRFRLGFHLPLPEKRFLLTMSSIGILSNLLLDFILIAGLWVIGTLFFPSEIVSSSIQTSLPWLLAGLTAYFAAAIIIVEPTWHLRIYLTIASSAFIMLFYKEYGYNEYQASLWRYALVTGLFWLAILFPGYRLRRGAR
jgi:hypothetical protein